MGVVGAQEGVNDRLSREVCSLAWPLPPPSMIMLDSSCPVEGIIGREETARSSCATHTAAALEGASRSVIEQPPYEY